MRKVELDQESEEWLNWRKGLLTATDAPMLLGVSPYVTPYKGWQRKVGQAPKQTENEATRQGKRDEPIAREWFNKEYGIEMEPCCIESEFYNFLGASLDGLSSCGRYILEIKSNGDQYHYGLKNGIPEFHLYQMQHQLLCSDNTAKMGFYLSFNKGEKIVKEVYPDKDWMKDYLDKAREFWKRVVFFDPPPLSSKDYKDMSEVYEWTGFSEQYRKVSEEIKKLEIVKENYRNELIKLCGDNSCSGNGIKVLKKFSKGRVDYKEVIETMNVQFDERHFRKEPSSTWAIMLDR